MVGKTIMKWAGVGAVLVLAACGEATGPMSDCSLGDDNILVCSTPTSAEPADAGVETIVY